jgi:hypothetical protein
MQLTFLQLQPAFIWGGIVVVALLFFIIPGIFIPGFRRSLHRLGLDKPVDPPKATQFSGKKAHIIVCAHADQELEIAEKVVASFQSAGVSCLHIPMAQVVPEWLNTFDEPCPVIQEIAKKYSNNSAPGEVMAELLFHEFIKRYTGEQDIIIITGCFSSIMLSEVFALMRYVRMGYFPELSIYLRDIANESYVPPVGCETIDAVRPGSVKRNKPRLLRAYVKLAKEHAPQIEFMILENALPIDQVVKKITNQITDGE